MAKTTKEKTTKSNTNKSNTIKPSAASATNLSLGGKLKTAREVKRLAVEDVAKSLFLHPQRIMEIENDDYTNFNSLVYVRGYLRNYAKLVDLSEQEIISEFDAKYTVEESKVASKKAIESSHKNLILEILRKNLRWINIGLLVIVIILLLSWWYSKRTPKSPSSVIDQNVIEQVITPPANVPAEPVISQPPAAKALAPVKHAPNEQPVKAAPTNSEASNINAADQNTNAANASTAAPEISTVIVTPATATDNQSQAPKTNE